MKNLRNFSFVLTINLYEENIKIFDFKSYQFRIFRQYFVTPTLQLHYIMPSTENFKKILSRAFIIISKR